MSEVKASYDSGAAPAPAATCPTCGAPAVLVGAPFADGSARYKHEPLPTPADPLTALERAALEAGIEHDGAMQMGSIVNQDGDQETRRVAREYVKETKHALRKAVDALQAARAAAGTGT